jgi:hypothetical protein
MATVEFPYERRLSEFDRTVAAAQREIALQVKLALREGDLRSRRMRLLQLARVTAILDQLGGYVDPTVRRLVAEAYEQSAKKAGQLAAGVAGAREVPGAFVGISREAISVLQDSAEASLRDARVRVGRQVADVYAKAGRMAATRAVLGVDGSPRTAARRMAADLMKDRMVRGLVGGPGFVDSAGRHWGLDRYSSMVVRTTTREAVVQGSIDRMVSHGVTLARFLVSASACAVCQQYSGRLVDLAGNGRDYEGEATMTGPTPPVHPRCTCTLSPFAVRVERLRRELAGGVSRA